MKRLFKLIKKDSLREKLQWKENNYIEKENFSWKYEWINKEKLYLKKVLREKKITL